MTDAPARLSTAIAVALDAAAEIRETGGRWDPVSLRVVTRSLETAAAEVTAEHRRGGVAGPLMWDSESPRRG